MARRHGRMTKYGRPLSVMKNRRYRLLLNAGPSGPADPEFITSEKDSNINWTASNPLVITHPAELEDGMLMVAHIFCNDDTMNLDDPAGWTKLVDGSSSSGDDRDWWTFVKIADGEGTTQQFTTPNVVSGDDGSVIMSYWKGFDGTLDIPYVEANHASITPNTNNCPTRDITTLLDGCLIMAFVSYTQGTATDATAPTGMTLIDFVGDSGNNIAVAYAFQASAGTFSGSTFPMTGASSGAEAVSTVLAFTPET
jgi:hypothetical protein